MADYLLPPQPEFDPGIGHPAVLANKDSSNSPLTDLLVSEADYHPRVRERSVPAIEKCLNWCFRRDMLS